MKKLWLTDEETEPLRSSFYGCNEITKQSLCMFKFSTYFIRLLNGLSRKEFKQNTSWKMKLEIATYSYEIFLKGGLKACFML